MSSVLDPFRSNPSVLTSNFITDPPAARQFPVRWAIVDWDTSGLSGLRGAPPQWMEYVASTSPGISIPPVSTTQALLLDFGRKTAGHLEMYLEEVNTARLEVRSGPVLGMVHFGDSLEVNCKEPGASWQDPEFRAFQFLLLRVEESALPSQPLHAHVSVQFTGLLTDYTGRFESGDEVLDRAYLAGAYTIQLCTQPARLSGCYNKHLPAHLVEFIHGWTGTNGQHVIWDGPRRDREVWVGDLWPEACAMLAAFGSVDPIKASLQIVADTQQTDGMIPGSAVTRQPFGEYACWWVTLLGRLWLWSGDMDFIKSMETPLRRQMEWLTGQLRKGNGWMVLGPRQTWAWTLSREGVVTCSQCVAYAALRSAARLMEEALDDSAEASRLDAIAANLRGRIRQELWSEGAGAFKDSLAPLDGKERVSCDSNSLAVIFGIADKSQASRALMTVKERLWGPFGTKTIDPMEEPSRWNWAHCHNVWPFVVGLEVEARLETGDAASALELMRQCWGNMVLRHNSQTLWEMVDGQNGDFVWERRVADTDMGGDTWNSASHGWSAGPTGLLPAYVLGVRPLEPGFNRTLIAPRLGDLASIEGSVPTPKGPIDIQVTRTGEVVNATITVPSGIRAVVTLDPQQTVQPSCAGWLEGAQFVNPDKAVEIGAGTHFLSSAEI